MPPATDAPLLDPDFMRKLEQWSLNVQRSFAGQYGGERRSTRHGQSVEFADFRNYVPGDDTRFVDWNLYARMERLFLKLFLHEQELNVHIFVDLSESMTFGEPSKALLARKLTAALGLMALARQDGLSIRVASEAGSARSRIFSMCHGRAYIRRMIEFMTIAPEGGAVDLHEFTRRQIASIPRPGLVILISDLMDESGYRGILGAIASRRHEAIVLHLLDREEWEPNLRGDLKLIDAEQSSVTEVSVTPAVLERYKVRAHAWSEEIRSYGAQRGMSYLRLLTDADPQDVILKTLRRMGRIA